MKYDIKSHPTTYDGVRFRSRLEARWAAFFDLARWQWEYEPIDLAGWSPDFRVEFHCGHSECGGSHTLLVEVKPYFTISDFDGHPCRTYPFGQKEVKVDEYGIITEAVAIPADASAAFGANPKTTRWEMCHGAGGGEFDVRDFVSDAGYLWKQAGEKVRYVAPARQDEMPQQYGRARRVLRRNQQERNGQQHGSRALEALARLEKQGKLRAR